MRFVPPRVGGPSCPRTSRALTCFLLAAFFGIAALFNPCSLSLPCVAILSAQAPLPAQLLQAKKVYLVNEGANVNVFDAAADELQKRKRFTLVASKDEADVVMTLGRVGSYNYGVVMYGSGGLSEKAIFGLKIEGRGTGE